MRNLTSDARIALIASPDRYSYVTDQFARIVGLSPAAQAEFEAITCARIGVPMEEAVGHRLMQEAGLPLLIVHCQDDFEVAFREAEIWNDNFPQATLHAVRGLGHRDIVTAPIVTTRVAGFISAGARQVRKSA
jgi:pimeloyl-ACP methyl ester carboxylesterase